jgi:hypothetical protein
MARETNNQGYIDAQAYASDPSNTEVPDSSRQEYEIGVNSFNLANQSGITTDDSGNVGIGTSSPQTELHVDGGADANTTFKLTHSSNTDGVELTANGVNGFVTNKKTNGNLSFATENVVRQTIDSSGNIGIGTSSPNALLELGTNTPQIRFTDSANASAYSSILGSDTGSLLMRADESGNGANSVIGFEIDGSRRVTIDSSGILAGSDNSFTNGGPSNRWSVVYAGTGTINTSDERDKTQLDIDAKVLAAVNSISVKAFKWKSAVESKGDSARIHYGVIAQEVKAAFEAQGLVAEDYGVLCYDEWEDEFETKTIEPAVTEQREVTPAVLDDEGNEVESAVFETVEITPEVTEEVLVKAAGNRYGVRYDELYAMKIAALEARITALESA